MIEKTLMLTKRRLEWYIKTLKVT